MKSQKNIINDQHKRHKKQERTLRFVSKNKQALITYDKNTVATQVISKQ